MKQTFKSYVGIWTICLAVFHVIAFIIPQEFKDNFWVGYIFIILAFSGQLFCTGIAFKAENIQKFFYKFPILLISWIGTLLMLVAGSLTIAISFIPVWVGIVICVTILAFTAIAIIFAFVASKTVSQADDKIKTQTIFIKTMIANAESLIEKADTEQFAAIAKRVYENFRYSDPMSNDTLSDIEAQIAVKFGEFETALTKKSPNIASLSEELIILIRDRNIKCKMAK